MGRKTKVALTVGAASVAAWAASKVVVKPEPRTEKKALQFSEIAVLANLDIAEDPSVHSLTEYMKTADLGVHGFVADIRLTKDEEIIIAPGSGLLPTGAIADYTLAELQHDYPSAVEKTEMTTEGTPSLILPLREVMQTFPQLLFVLAMGDSPDTYEGSLIPSKLWRLLKEMDAAERVAVTSVYDEQIDRFNLYAQNSVALGAGSEEIKKAYVAYTSKFGHLYRPNADVFCLPEKLGMFPLASDGFVQFLQQLNIAVFYELDDPADLEKQAKLDFDGFITSKPDTVLEYFSDN